MRIFFLLLLFVVGCGAANDGKQATQDQASETIEDELQATNEIHDGDYGEDHPTYEGFVGQSSTPETSMAVKKIVYRGSGCPENSVAASISEDKKAFTLIFDKNFVDVEAGGHWQRKRVDCLIQLSFAVPAGWSFGILSTQLRGYVDLDEGASAFERLSLYTKHGFQRIHEKSFHGAMSQDYLSESTLALRAVAWTPCRSTVKTLTLKTSLFMYAAKGSGGVLAMDSADGELSQNYKLAWRRCR